jgi:DNA-binding NarL/FixJ family response regulator
VAALDSVSAGNNKFKTLIVEDNALFRQTFKEGLQTLFPSMMIQEAAEGVDALEKVDTFHPRLIFMDIHLPGENGLQLTRKIKANYPDVAVVILTSHDIPEYREAALQCGARCFFPKDSFNKVQIETLVNSF